MYALGSLHWLHEQDLLLVCGYYLHVFQLYAHDASQRDAALMVPLQYASQVLPISQLATALDIMPLYHMLNALRIAQRIKAQH